MKKETVWFRCPADLKSRINALAKQEGRTPSNMIVRLLDSAIDSYEAIAHISNQKTEWQKTTSAAVWPSAAEQKRGQK